MLRPWQSGVVTAVLLIGTVAWLVTVTNLVGAYGSGSIKPTALDLLAFMVLMALPLVVVAPIMGWLQKRRLRGKV
jgi:hypothetical protein